MKDELFLVCGFSWLLFWQECAQRPFIKLEGRHLKGALAQGLEFFLHGVILILMSLVVLELFPEVGWERWSLSGLWVMAYGLARSRAWPAPFFVISFALTYLILERLGFQKPFAMLRTLAVLVALMTVSKVMIFGLHERLLFSRVPDAFSGLPVLFILYAFLTTALELLTSQTFPK